MNYFSKRTDNRTQLQAYRILAALCFTFIGDVAFSKDFYVSKSGRDSASGTKSAPWRTIDKANKSAQPGDTIIIRAGEYSEVIRPSRSGRAGNLIRYSSYPGEVVVITDPPAGNGGAKTAIELIDRNYIEVSGIRVNGKRLSVSGVDSNVDSFAVLIRANYNVIRNSQFQYANGYIGVRISGGSEFNRIVDNTFDAVGTNHIPDGYSNAGSDRGDILAIRDGSRNLIQGNRFTRGGHNTIDIIGSYNVIRGNVFDGKWTGTQSPGARAGGDLSANVKYDAPKPGGFNLFEFNIVRNAAASGDNPENNGMKVQGTSQIVRANYFYDNVGAAISGATREGSIEATRNNRIYNNTFVNNGYLFVYRDYGNRLPFSDNVWKNNLVADHKLDLQISAALDTSERINSKSSNGLNETVIAGNIFEPTFGGSIYLRFVVNGSGVLDDLEWFEQNYSANIFDNQIAKISFRNGRSRTREGLAVPANSPAVDSGIALTTTSGSGSGNAVRVRDPRYFYDGYNIPGEFGDLIVVGAESARIIKVDHARKELILDRSITWSGNAQVHLQFDGAGPDVGAHEIYELRSGSGPSIPMSPSSENRPLPPTILPRL